MVSFPRVSRGILKSTGTPSLTSRTTLAFFPVEGEFTFSRAVIPGGALEPGEREMIPSPAAAYRNNGLRPFLYRLEDHRVLPFVRYG
jgi:hypothetical protein